MATWPREGFPCCLCSNLRSLLCQIQRSIRHDRDCNGIPDGHSYIPKVTNWIRWTNDTGCAKKTTLVFTLKDKAFWEFKYGSNMVFLGQSCFRSCVKLWYIFELLHKFIFVNVILCFPFYWWFSCHLAWYLHRWGAYLGVFGDTLVPLVFSISS